MNNSLDRLMQLTDKAAIRRQAFLVLLAVSAATSVVQIANALLSSPVNARLEIACGMAGLGACLLAFILTRLIGTDWVVVGFLLITMGLAGVYGTATGRVQSLTLLVAIPIVAASVVLRPWASLVCAALVSATMLAISREGALRPVGIADAAPFFALAVVAFLFSQRLENALSALACANRSLEEDSERYKALFEFSKDAIMIIKDGRFAECNVRACELFGLSKEEICRLTPAELSPPDQPSGERSQFLAAKKIALALQGEPQSFEWQHLRADGTPFWAHVSLHRVELGDNVYVQVILRDETEAKVREAALRESEEKYRQLFELESDAVFLVDTETNQIIEANASAARLYGYTQAELLQKKYHELCARPEAIRALRQQHKSNAAVRFHCRKDGSIFPVEISTTHYTWGGREVHTAAIRDITPWLQAQEEIEHQRALVIGVIEEVPYPIFVIDRDMRFIMANRAFAELFGQPLEKIVGRTPFEMMPYESEATAFEQRNEEVLRSGRPADNLEEMITDCRGMVHILHVIRKPFALAADSTASVLGVAVDITERKRIEEHLIESQKMEAIGRLSAGVAHDFNNLLTIINGYSSFLLESLPKGNPMCEDLEEIRQAGQRAGELTRRLLAFGRQQAFEPQLVNLNTVLRDTAKVLERVIGEQVQLALQLEEDLPPIMADPSQLEQVLMNLAVNARDAMPEGGTLTLSTARVRVDERMALARVDAGPGDYVLLTVSDTGPGLPPEVMAHLFEPFVTTKEPGKGTGLGLATVYGIVKQCGGSIYAENQPGSGARFSIYFPIQQQETAVVYSTGEADRLAEGSETILLVEDEQNVRTLVARHLQRLGYQVLVAESGAKALDVLDEHGGQVDLLLTDVIMPEMSGRSLAERVRETAPRIRILYMTGYSAALLENQVLQADDSPILQKPFSIRDLALTVREALDGHGVALPYDAPNN